MISANDQRTFQTEALEKLLEWGSVSLEKSINQPILPHAIIIVNASELSINEEEWDPKKATAKLLASVKGALGPIADGGVPQIIEYANRWRSSGKINSVEALIHCYYSSFTVVRLPTRGSYGLLGEQISKLHERISCCCEQSHLYKRAARTLSTSEQLNVYLQAAFDHFSKRLDKPFNFIKVSLRIKPIPSDFGDHVLQMANTIRGLYPIQKGVWIFHHLSYLVASCVTLDVVRNRQGMYRFPPRIQS
jgi:hypothetical protein